MFELALVCACHCTQAELTPPDAAVTSTDTTTLQDIIGNEQAKRMLLENVVLPLRAGPAFRKQVLSACPPASIVNVLGVNTDR